MAGRGCARSLERAFFKRERLASERCGGVGTPRLIASGRQRKLRRLTIAEMTMFRRACLRHINKSTRLRADQRIIFITYQARHDYPEALCRVTFYAVGQSRRLGS